jgi:hypothetical protein
MAVSRWSRAVIFTGWTLGFKPCSLHPGDWASTGVGVNGFVAPGLSEQALVPWAFASGLDVPPGKFGGPGVACSPPPVLQGIKRRRDTAHRLR